HDAGRIDSGFDHSHLGVISYNVANVGYSQARGTEYHQRVLERAAAVPGVIAAALSRDNPMTVGLQRSIRVDGRDDPASPARPTLISIVWPGYFRGIGIPLVRGRDFSMQDGQTAPRVAIVNQTAGEALWPGDDPIGKRISFVNDQAPTEIVGVARTVNYQN